MFAMDDVEEPVTVPSIVMAKPPAVSDFASTLSSVIATASSQHSENNIEEPVMIRSGFDADVLWKPPRLSRSRTVSTESADSEFGRSMPVNDQPLSTEERRTGRRFSLSEMIFGSPNRYSMSVPPQNSITEGAETLIGRIRKPSVTEDERFKEILRAQKDETGIKRL